MTDQIPEGFDLQRTTPTFDNDSVPAGLLKAHQVADRVWGRLVVHTGELTFVFEDTGTPLVVHAGDHVVIPPTRPHHLELDAPATFAVEFYASRSNPRGERRGPESSGLAADD